jgi:hypothetical protein
MEFIKLVKSVTEHYQYEDASNIAMNILGNFLASDAGCSTRLYMKPTYQEWALDDSLGMGFSGNITYVDKEGENIFIGDLFSEEEIPTRLKISRQQFIQLMNNWEKKVCEHKPREVIIRHENNQFTIETKD